MAHQLGDESGQVVVLVAVCLVVFIGMLGLTVDVGRYQIQQRRLQSATDAAALAAAQDLPDGTTANTTACTYSATAGNGPCNGSNIASDGNNANAGLPGVETTTQLECLSTASAGIGCTTGPGCPANVPLPPANTPSGGCNAIKVTEQASVAPLFMQVLGFGSKTIKATATASMAGGQGKALDIELLADTTGSMESQCSSNVAGIPTSSDTPTKLDCAKEGVRALLGTLFPSLDRVGLMVFPAVNSTLLPTNSAGVVPQETDCTDNVSSSDVTYTTNPNYQVVPFSSDYRTSDSATSLNKNSSLVQAVWWKNCPGGVYPAGGGGGASSIVGGTSSDLSTASNGAGISAPGSSDRSGASNGAGLAGGPGTGGNQSGASNGPGLGGGPGTSANESGATNGPALGGGPNSGSSNDRSTATTSSGTSITLSRPTNRADGDFLLVTVTGQSASVTGTSSICAATPAEWTLVDQQRVTAAGSSTPVIQATFRSFRSGTAAESYTFNFRSGPCPSGGSALTVDASALAIRYTHVDPANPIDVASGTAGANTNFAGSAASTTWNSTAHYVSLSSSCVNTSSSTCNDTTITTAGTLTTATFTFGTAPAGGSNYSIVLFRNGSTTGSSCAITGNGSTTGCTITANVAVSVNDTIELQVNRTSGSGTSTTATATTAAVKSSGGGTTLTAPAVNTTQTNDQVLRLFGTGSTSFTGGSGLPFAISGSSTATGMNDAIQTTVGTSGTATATSSTSDNWVAQTVALREDRSSITISRPATALANDFLLTSVTAKGLNGGTVCAPNGTWTQVVQTTQGSGATSVTQATFSSVRSAAGAETYTFNFVTASSCGSGSPTSVAATAVAVRYTGVDSASPVDASGGGTTGSANPGTAATAPSVTTSGAADQVVRFYGTGATSFNGATVDYSQPGSATATGVKATTGGPPGATGMATATSGSSSNWVGQTVALTNDSGSISVNRPSTRAAGDFLLVSVTAQGIAGGLICAPDTTWTRVSFPASPPNPATQGSGANSITQATFWSVRAGAGAETYQFSFVTGGSCSSGTTAGAPASAVAVRYTGVDSANPIDKAASAITPSPNPGTTLTASAVTPTLNDDRVVSLYGTGATSFAGGATFSQAGASTATAVTDAPGPSAGVSSGTTTASTSPTSANWVAQTVALRESRTSISINRPTNAAADDFLLVSVTARGLDSGSICPADNSWTQVIQTSPQVSGAASVRQAVFRSFRGDANAETYQFKFVAGSSCASPGNPQNAAASAVTVRYTGVDPTNPIDPGGSGVAGTASAAPGTTITAPPASTSLANERVVRFYGTGATSFSSTVPQFTQAGAATASGVSDAPQPGTGTTGAATAGTPSANWVGQTVALNTRTSITIGRPPNRSDADFMLVSVTAQDLGGGSICAPNDGTWTLVQQRQQPGSGASTITQATFWSVRGTTNDELYQFDFRTSCPGGTPIAASASAIAVRYTGVNLLSPIDPIAPTSGNSANPAVNSGSGTTLTALSVTASANDQVVRFYGTGATSISGVTQASTGSTTATGFEDSSQTTTGSTGTATATAASDNWVAATIALQASGPGCSSNCWYGIEDGSNTAYAGAINAAQTALVNNGRPDAQRVIIMFSDGAANTGGTNPCQQGITAAENAETPLNDGSTTWVFMIYYGANETCVNDSPAITALCAMHVMAHNYVTDPAGVSPGIANQQSVCSNNASEPAHNFYNQPSDGDLTSIFRQIGTSLTSARLVSDNAA